MGGRIGVESVPGQGSRFNFTISAVPVSGAQPSHVELELLIVPKLPVPGSLVTRETAYAADKAVTGVRDRAEHK